MNKKIIIPVVVIIWYRYDVYVTGVILCFEKFYISCKITQYDCEAGHCVVISAGT